MSTVRGTQLEQNQQIDELRRETWEGFAVQPTGMAQISALLATRIEKMKIIQIDGGRPAARLCSLEIQGVTSAQFPRRVMRAATVSGQAGSWHHVARD